MATAVDAFTARSSHHGTVRSEMERRVAVIGSGVIGTTLARRLAQGGMDVRVGVRDPSSAKARALADAEPELTLAPVAKAIETAEVVIVAIPGAALEGFVAEWGEAIGDRIVLDTTNNREGEHLHGMEHWRRLAPETPVFRAFCTSGWETFADPDFGAVAVDVFYCGPGGEAAGIAEEVIAVVGTRPVRLGDADAADVVDGITRAWFALVFRERRGRQIAFKLLERADPSSS
jgi:predicted dinucleotide-binding enzyme